VKTITIRDLRRKWLEVEYSLRREGEILVTRRGILIARLINIPPEQPKRRRRWNMEAHRRWQERVSGGKITSSDESLARSRADRKLL